MSETKERYLLSIETIPPIGDADSRTLEGWDKSNPHLLDRSIVSRCDRIAGRYTILDSILDNFASAYSSFFPRIWSL